MEKALGSLGRAFIFAGLAPAVVFLAAQAAVIWLVASGHPELRSLGGILSPGAGEPGLDWTTLLLVGVVAVGAILLALNGVIIHLYEGAGGVLSSLLAPWRRRNLRRHAALYGDVLALRSMRAKVLTAPSDGKAADDPERIRRLYSTELQLADAYARVEAAAPIRDLPIRPELVKATALGNAYAVLEEYPFERYGIDSMVFWSRLVAVVPGGYLQSIGEQKTICDALLHLSLLSWLVGLEALAIGAVGAIRGAFAGEAVLATAIGLVVGYLLYRAAVNETVVLGKLIGGAFDLYRHGLLRQLGIEPPAGLDEERAIWQRLAAFIRRGDDFYYAEARAGRATPTPARPADGAPAASGSTTETGEDDA